MAGLVRGFANMIGGGDCSRGVATHSHSNPNMNCTPLPLQPPAAGLLNLENQKLFAVTNNPNKKLKGDRNGALTLGNFK